MTKVIGAKIVVLGPVGSFSDFAASTISDTRVYANSFFEAIRMVNEGNAEVALLPIENSIGGSVAEVADLLSESNLKIVSELKVAIKHCFAGLKVDSIDCIMSHPQALAQCSHVIQKYPEARVLQMDSTAKAFKKIADEKLSNTVAVGSEFAANLYGLDIIEKEVQNNSNNYTRFIALAKFGLDKGNKGTLIIIPHKDQPGTLYNILGIFNKYSLNLSRVESRPSKKELGNYVFHVDVNIDDWESYLNAKQDLKLNCDIIEIGEYCLLTN